MSLLATLQIYVVLLIMRRSPQLVWEPHLHGLYRPSSAPTSALVMAVALLGFAAFPIDVRCTPLRRLSDYLTESVDGVLLLESLRTHGRREYSSSSYAFFLR
jgi:hypothetical protein